MAAAAALPVVLAPIHLSNRSLHDFMAGSVDQTYYGATNLLTGETYLVASPDSGSGHFATRGGTFQNIPQTALHGQHLNYDKELQNGQGHLNAMVISNAFFTITQFRSGNVVCFAIRKTGALTFTFIGNSSVNEWRHGNGNRSLPPAESTHIQQGLQQDLNARAAPNCTLL